MKQRYKLDQAFASQTILISRINSGNIIRTKKKTMSITRAFLEFFLLNERKPFVGKHVFSSS